MEDFGHADSGNVTTAVADFNDGRGMGDFGDDVGFHLPPGVIIRHHVSTAVLIQEWADESRHIGCLFVPLKDVSGGVITGSVLHDLGRGFGGGDGRSHSYE
jgi:hypothetical protein